MLIVYALITYRYNNVYWGDLIQEMLGTYVFRDSKAGVQVTNNPPVVTFLQISVSVSCLPISPSPYMYIAYTSLHSLTLPSLSTNRNPIHDFGPFPSQCTVVLNGVKGAPSDVIIGSIERLGQDGLPVDGDPVCTLEGSWLGFLDFGGIRSES
jgi:hypothetical protein